MEQETYFNDISRRRVEVICMPFYVSKVVTIGIIRGGKGMKKKKLFACITTLMLAVSMLAGCGNSSSSNNSNGRNTVSNETVSDDTSFTAKAVSEDAEYKDELHVAMGTAPATLDVMMGTDYIPRIIAYGNIYESLVTLTADYNWKEELAESVEVNDEHTEYIYHLRQGVKFHDETEMTADDVVASMNRWIEKYSNAKNMVGDAGFEKVDDYTVTIKTEEPALFLNELIATQSQGSVIMPASVIEGADASTGVSLYIGTGPYKFVEWKDGQYIKLEKFEDYQPYGTAGETDGWWGYKAAPTRFVYFDLVTDSSTRVAGISSGEYDFAHELPTDNFGQFGDESSYQIYKDVLGCFAVVYNKAEGICSNASFRQAVNAILNPKEILTGAYGSDEFYRIETSYMGSEMVNWYTTAGEENAHKADAEAAKKYLEEAGYNGETFRILVRPSNPDFVNAAVVIQQELGAIGVNAEIVSVDNSTYQTYRNDPTQYDIFFTNALPVSVPTIQIFLSSTWAGFTSDPVILDGVQEINNCTSLDEAKQKWDTLQGYCWTDSLPITKLGTSFSYSVSSTEVVDMGYFNGPLVGNAKVIK